MVNRLSVSDLSAHSVPPNGNHVPRAESRPALHVVDRSRTLVKPGHSFVQHILGASGY